MGSEEKLLKKIRKYSDRLDRCRRKRKRSHSRGRSRKRHRSHGRSRSITPSHRSRSPAWEQTSAPSVSLNIGDNMICQGSPCSPHEETHPELTYNEAPETINLDSPELQPTNQTEKEPNEELLHALGEEYEDCKRYEGEINTDICKRWDYILTHGLSKNEKDEIMKKNILPENCQLLDAPILNEEVGAVISESGKNRDKSLVYQQKQMGMALAITGKVMSKVIKHDIDKLEIIKSLSESTKLLTDLHYQLTKTRRTLVSPQLDKKFLEMMENTKRNQFLYGENLCEKIKTNKQIQQSSNSIKKTVTKPVSSTAKNNNISNKYSGNRGGPPRPVNQRQPARSMARGGPRNRTAQPSQHRPIYHSQHSERGRGARYNSRR